MPIRRNASQVWKGIGIGPGSTFRVAFWAMSGHGGSVATQKRAECRQSPLAPTDAQNAYKNYSICPREGQSYRWLRGRFPGGKPRVLTGEGD